MPPIAHGKFTGRSLIVFGCGYVGTEVAREAVAAGLTVTALTRNVAKAAKLAQLGVRVVVQDLASDAWHAQMPGQPDFVLNAVSSGGAGLEGYRHSYLGGMQSILRWASSSGPIGTIVYTSSTSVYPQGDGAVVDERASTEGGGDRAQILLEAENALRNAAVFSAAGGADADARRPFERYFVLRLAGIYGPGRHHLLAQIQNGEVAGRGEHRLNLAHRDDIAAAIWAAFAAPKHVRNEIFNVADEEAARKSDVANWLAEQLGVPPPHFSGVPAGNRRAVTPDRIISNAKIKSVLGWRPRFASFREGYAQILEAR